MWDLDIKKEKKEKKSLMKEIKIARERLLTAESELEDYHGIS